MLIDNKIGVLKAIGASNLRVGLLFGLESLWISLLAAIFGSFVAFSLARPIGRLVVGLGRGGIQSILNNRGAIAGVQLTVSSSVIVLALLAAIMLTVLASILSSWYVGRVKPAEVLRNG